MKVKFNSIVMAMTATCVILTINISDATARRMGEVAATPAAEPRQAAVSHRRVREVAR